MQQPNPLLSDSRLSDTFRKRLDKAAAILDQKTKPQGSLGLLESIAMQVSAIQNSPTPDVERARAILFAADHGVMAEGVSAYPQAVTQQMLHNFVNGGAAANALCMANATELEVVDVGVIGDAIPGVVSGKVANGTANMAQQSAMSEAQLSQAMQVGRDAIQRAASEDIALIALGEMGIGNTTSAAAIVSALCGVSAAESVGPGTGLDQQGITKKVSVVSQVLNTHKGRHPQAVLQNMGGFEIAALCGAMQEACNYKITVIVDGYIVTAAALCAVGMQPSTREHLVFAHKSAEPGHTAALTKLCATPILDLGLRLGEGSGAILAIPLIRSAVAILNEMSTFEDEGVDREI